MPNGNGQILFRYYGNVLSLSQASATSDGYLSKVDWNRFNAATDVAALEARVRALEARLRELEARAR